jgi:hypothetical protein
MPWVSLLVGLLLTLFIILIIILHTDFFAHSVGVMFSRYLFHGTPFALSIDQMSGNPLKDITVENLRIRYRGDEFSFDIVRVEEIRAKFNFLALFTDAPRLDELVLVNPHVWIKPDSSGAAIMPGRKAGGGGSIPDFSIGAVSIRGGQVIVQGREKADAIRNINLDAGIDCRGGSVTASIEAGSAESLTREIVLRRLDGKVRWNRNPPVLWRAMKNQSLLELAGLRLELEESAMTVRGLIVPDSARVYLAVEAEPMEVEELARALDIETGHFGELQGAFNLRGTPDSLRIVGRWNGILSGYALNDLEIDLTVNDDLMTINHTDGIFNGAYVTGSGFYTLDGTKTLSLDVEVGGLNLAEGFAAGRSLPETRLNGDVEFIYRVPDGSIFFNADLGEGHLRKLPFEHAVISGSYMNEDLSLDRLVLTHPTHTISSHGVIAGGDTLQFYVDVECQAQDTLFGYLGIERYRADLRMNGIIEGSFDFWQWRSNGSIENFTYRNAHVSSGDVKLVVDRSENYQVFFDLTGNDCTIERASFSDIDLSLEYWRGTTNIKRLHLSREGFEAEARGEIITDGPVDEIRVGELQIDSFEETWLSSGRFRIVASDSSLLFDDLQLHSKLGALYLNCSMDRKSRSIEGTLAFRRLGLDFLNHAGVVSVPLEGRAEGTISCDGALTDPDISCMIDLRDARVDTVTIDDLRIRGRYAGSAYHIDSLVVSSPNGRCELSGDVEGVPLEELYKSRTGALRGAVVEATMSCTDLKLKPFVAAFDGFPFSDGSLTGTVMLSDSLVHPRVTVDGKIENLETRFLSIPVVMVRAVFGRGWIDLDGTVSLASGHEGVFDGRIPIRDADWFYRIDSGAPMALEFELSDGDLETLPAITDIVAEASGGFSTSFRIEGTTSRPNITGQVLLDDAGFRLSGMDENFHDVNARIQVDDTLVTVSLLEGKEGKEGKFKCTGTISLSGWKPYAYALSIDAEKFLLASIPDVVALLSGSVQIDARPYEDRVVPMVTGRLTVNNAEIYYDLGDLMKTGGSTTMATPSWVAEIELAVPGNAWIKTTEARVELEGDVTLHHDNRGTYLRGQLRLVRGWYNVYNNKFRVKSGTFEFVHAGSYRPVVDIEAETRDPEGRRIFLNLAWHQDDIEPRLTLSHEDPGYSETDIWKMLGGGVVGSPNGESTSWDAISTAQNLAANYIENVLNSQMEGVTIELESTSRSGSSNGGLEESETMIAIGKYLSEGLYVKYKQGLSISTAREIEVEYRISNLFLIRSQIIKYSEKVIEGKSQRSTDEINLDIKLRWEF